MRLTTSVAMLATCVLLAGCGGGGNEDLTGPSSNGSMSATINGTAWSATTVTQASRAGNVLAIGGNNPSWQVLLTIPNVTAPGTYTVAASGGTMQLVQANAGGAAWTASILGGQGTVTVTTLSAERAVGTFSFTGNATAGTPAGGTRNVTAGQFDVRF
jgi:hypothetical protein